MTSPEKKILTPILHLNGSSYERLFELHAEATGALRNAMDKLADAAPHGRDFYVQGDDALGLALREYEDRRSRVQSVIAELEQILESLTDQHAERTGS